MKTQISIGKEAAIELAKSKWWKSKTAREIAEFQLFTTELSVPFDVFHKAIEDSLGRPVWTHEFATNWSGICAEFLGEKPPPTLAEIMELIPEEKRIMILAK